MHLTPHPHDVSARGQMHYAGGGERNEGAADGEAEQGSAAKVGTGLMRKQVEGVKVGPEESEREAVKAPRRDGQAGVGARMVGGEGIATAGFAAGRIGYSTLLDHRGRGGPI